MTETVDVTDRTALVTGAGSGIGRAIAVALAAEGMTIVLAGRRVDGLRATATAVGERRGRAIVASIDLASDADLETLTSQVRSAGGGMLHVLVHAAATHVRGAVDELSSDELDQTIRVNLRAPMLLTRLVLPMLRAAPGDVVFVNSSAALSSPSSSAAYAASKAALRSAADSIRQRVNEDGIRVVSIFPGRTATGMQEAMFRDEGRPYRPELLLQPDDVAAAIISVLALPRTAEVTEVHLRPAIKSY
jgi:NAD(P)-dependent dehydrogenase (short-subunit alcohol dehydrogenase family)